MVSTSSPTSGHNMDLKNRCRLCSRTFITPVAVGMDIQLFPKIRNALDQRRISASCPTAAPGPARQKEVS
jgi:hypothetical protein